MAGANENSPDDMGNLVRNCDRIREATGAHVLLIHHSGKDASKGARGHSLLHAAVDTAIEISRDGKNGIIAAHVRKQRELDCSGAFAYTLKPMLLGYNQRGKPVTSCVVEHVDAAPADSANPTRLKLGANETICLAALKQSLAEAGVPAPGDPHYPPRATIVGVQMWRRYAEMRLTGESKYKKQKFDRAAVSLQSKGLVQKWGLYAWLVEPATKHTIH